jgi:ribonuclease T1
VAVAGGRRANRPLLALIVLLVALGIGYGVHAANSSDGSSTPKATVSTSAGATVPLSSLPSQATDTVRLIQHRGPYPYSQDGVVFNNAEHHLPKESSGYYHEYTVKTPGSSDRGARRIITGSAGEYYYTDDHYDSFVKVDADE